MIVRRTGGPDVMQVIEDELPVPGSGQARVKILAADVGVSDANVRRGLYPGAPRPPFTPGYAMVGVVDQLGPDTWLEVVARVNPVTAAVDALRALVVAARRSRPSS